MNFALVLVGLIWIFSIFCFFGSAISFSLFDISPSMFSLMFGLKINDSYVWKQFGLLTFLFTLELVLIIFGIYVINSIVKGKEVEKTLKVGGFGCFVSFVAMIISFCTSNITETDYASELGSGAISYGVMQIISIVIFIGVVIHFSSETNLTYSTKVTSSTISKTTFNSNTYTSTNNLNSKNQSIPNNNNLSSINSKESETNSAALNDNNANQSITKSEKAVTNDVVLNNSTKEILSKIEAKESMLSNSRKEYKVLSQKDQWFNGKFDPYILESALNSYAKQGWRVVSAFSADIIGFIGPAREEAIIILEREVNK